ncbi:MULTISPECIES: hypothetical protein [Sulfurisphaera]|uniref:Uncharacterized protein n=2 Tax=Sulfurisphaera tokodaii TaxID=111955 RepID=F9VPF3_SULTO|nr:hypothetical protein [Sulfurisphaera tokodaii]BAK54800.1 hypothetical protein STK_24260 [Sulfurisphaera tokodaii str. 7]HII74074.1 hypothetical protein [Sulfurisphaera tokodaii]
MNDIIERFVELEEGDENEVKLLKSLWSDKITKLTLSDFQTLEMTEGNVLLLQIHRGNIISLLHKPSGLFLLIYGVSALEIETLRYITLKSKNPDTDFVALVYEYLNKGNARLGFQPNVSK